MSFISGPLPTDYSIHLATRTGSYIANVQGSNAQPGLLQFTVEHWQRQFRHLQPITVDGMYNCIGLAFASRRTTIEPKLVRWILQEDDYRIVNRDERPMIGDIVLYGTGSQDDQIEHLGIVWRLEPDTARGIEYQWILSKWGAQGPECLHRLEDIPPVFGTVLEYWRKRQYDSK